MVRETLANAARDWMAARAEDLLPVDYFHAVFTLPAGIAQVAFWNKTAVYDLLFRASAETVMTLAADPRRMGARVGTTAVLACLSRYTHRVAIPNSRLVSADAGTVAFRWKDYRIKRGDRQRVMRLGTGAFIRRFLLHVLPAGFRRIRHYGLLANAGRKANSAKIRAMPGTERPTVPPNGGGRTRPADAARALPLARGSPMRVIEVIRRGQKPRSRAPPRDQAA